MKIEITRSRKINLQNYENEDISITLTSGEIEEDFNANYQSLSKKTEELLAEEVAKIEKKKAQR